MFGGFYSVAVTKQEERFYDPTIFVFSFESHGRCMTPQRFVVEDEVRSEKYVRFFKDNSNERFVDVGGWFGYFFLGNKKSDTWCSALSSGFVGIQNTTLTGNTYPDRFTCTRVVAVHLQ